MKYVGSCWAFRPTELVHDVVKLISEVAGFRQLNGGRTPQLAVRYKDGTVDATNLTALNVEA